MKYTTIHGIIKMPERQPFCLVLDRSTLTKVENSASTYDAQFLLPENDIDWIPLIEEKITKQGKMYAEWGNPKQEGLNNVEWLQRGSTVDISNTAAVILSVEKIEDEIVKVRFSLREGKPTELFNDPNEPFIFTLRHIANFHADGTVKNIYSAVALDILYHYKSDKPVPHVMVNPLPTWILLALHPHLVEREEKTMENVNTEQALESITLATGESLAPQEIERERVFNEMKQDADIQPQEVEFNQPSVEGMILEEQEFGAKIIKIAPVISDHKETLSDVIDVMVINAAAGNTPRLITESEADIVRQTKIDLSECLELLSAVVFGDTIELQDALSDKRVTMNGFATFLPISLSDNFAVTRDMLFTRFDATVHNAVRTQEKYRALGVETYITESIVAGNSYYANKVAEDVTGTDGEFYPRDKFLKSVNYKKENFSAIDGLFDPEDTNAVSGRWNVLRMMLEKFITETDTKVADLVGHQETETK